MDENGQAGLADGTRPSWGEVGFVANWCEQEVERAFVDFSMACDSSFVTALMDDLDQAVGNLVDSTFARSISQPSDALVVENLRTFQNGPADDTASTQAPHVGRVLYRIVEENRRDSGVKAALHVRMRSAVEALRKKKLRFRYPAIQPITFEDDSYLRMGKFGSHYRRVLTARNFSDDVIQDVFVTPHLFGLDLFVPEDALLRELLFRALQIKRESFGGNSWEVREQEAVYDPRDSAKERANDSALETLQAFASSAERVVDVVNRLSYLAFVTLYAARMIQKRSEASEIIAAYGRPAAKLGTIKSHIRRFTEKLYLLELGEHAETALRNCMEAVIEKGKVDMNSTKSVNKAIGRCHHWKLLPFRKSARAVFDLDPELFFQSISNKPSIQSGLRELIEFAEQNGAFRPTGTDSDLEEDDDE